MNVYHPLKIKVDLSFNELMLLYQIINRHEVDHRLTLQDKAVVEFLTRMHLQLDHKLILRKPKYSLKFNATEAYFMKLFMNQINIQNTWEQNILLRINLQIDQKSA
ncbi:MAG: hypothetical protein WCL00_06090 [Bacteroidota bacterium]